MSFLLQFHLWQKRVEVATYNSDRGYAIPARGVVVCNVVALRLVASEGGGRKKIAAGGGGRVWNFLLLTNSGFSVSILLLFWFDFCYRFVFVLICCCWLIHRLWVVNWCRIVTVINVLRFAHHEFKERSPPNYLSWWSTKLNFIFILSIFLLYCDCEYAFSFNFSIHQYANCISDITDFIQTTPIFILICSSFQSFKSTCGMWFWGGQLIYGGPLGWNSHKIIEYFKVLQPNTYNFFYHKRTIFMLTLLLQEIQDVLKIKALYNPATWMLEVSSIAAEVWLGMDFVEYYKSAFLFQ